MKPDAKVISEAVRQVERRRRRRKLVFAAILIAVLVAAFFLIRCRGGFGLGAGDGRGLAGGEGPATVRPATGTAPAIDAAVRCAVRVDATGVSLDGQPSTVADAVAACRAVRAADVVVTGDARQGTWDELRGALEAAGVQTFVKGAGALEAVDAGS